MRPGPSLQGLGLYMLPLSTYCNQLRTLPKGSSEPDELHRERINAILLMSDSLSRNMACAISAMEGPLTPVLMQAKKIDEIHAEAHAELGMVPTTNLPLFQALPALPAAVVGPSTRDIELFPAFRGGGGVLI